jgi:hypothetical protein
MCENLKILEGGNIIYIGHYFLPIAYAIFILTQRLVSVSNNSTVCGNPFWESKPELFSDIACLRIPYQPCIVLFGKLFSGTPASNRRELRLHLNVMPTGTGVFKSRHILLHKYVNRLESWSPTFCTYDARYSSSFPAAASDPSPFWLVLKVCHMITFSITWYQSCR